MDEAAWRKAFAGARVAITGGMGFIGSTLAHRLAALGSEVTLIDNRTNEGGANPQNLAGLEGRVTLAEVDIRDIDRLRPLIAGRRYLFNLAALTSHMGSMEAPLEDFDVNGRAQLALMELCRREAPEIVTVYASTRQVYGRTTTIPVDESHWIAPPDVNGVSKLAGEHFHLLYRRVYGLATCALRLTNTYGPRMRIKDARQSFLGLWVRRALEGAPFEVWDDGSRGARRDLTYVEDAANAFLVAATTPALFGRALNIGGDALRLVGLAERLIEANGGGHFTVREFPAERKRIDIGDYEADDRAFRLVSGWQRKTPLGAGLKLTLDYFRANLAHYL